MLDRAAFVDCVLFRVAPHIFCDLHAAEMRSAHRAEMGTLRPFRGKGLIVKRAGSLGVEGEIELVFPAEFEARLTNSVVAVLRAGMAFG